MKLSNLRIYAKAFLEGAQTLRAGSVSEVGVKGLGHAHEPLQTKLGRHPGFTSPTF